MRVNLMVGCIATWIVLLSGCRTTYLIEPQVLHAAWMEKNKNIVVGVVPAEEHPEGQPLGRAPRDYLPLSTLRVDGQGKDRYLRVSAPDRRDYLRGGIALLVIGLGSIIGGAIAYHELTHYSCTGRECGVGQGYSAYFVAVPTMIGGGIETIVGGSLLAAGILTPGPVRRGLFDTVYMPNPDVAATSATPSGRPPVSSAALGVGIRF